MSTSGMRSSSARGSLLIDNDHEIEEHEEGEEEEFGDDEDDDDVSDLLRQVPNEWVWIRWFHALGDGAISVPAVWRCDVSIVGADQPVPHMALSWVYIVLSGLL